MAIRMITLRFLKEQIIISLLCLILKIRAQSEGDGKDARFVIWLRFWA
jgi:hypothetical protein